MPAFAHHCGPLVVERQTWSGDRPLPEVSRSPDTGTGRPRSQHCPAPLWLGRDGLLSGTCQEMVQGRPGKRIYGGDNAC